MPLAFALGSHGVAVTHGFCAIHILLVLAFRSASKRSVGR